MDLWSKGEDLRDLFRPGGGTSRMTGRRLRMMLDALPGDGHYKTAIRDAIPAQELAQLARANKRPEHGAWSHTDMLLAEVIDRLGHLGIGLRVYKDVEPYRRPGVVTRFDRRRGNDEARAKLRAIAEEHARLHGYTLDDPA